LKLIIFDLDGTLVDSALDIALSANELLEVMEREPLPLERIVGFIGDGVRKLLDRSLGGVSDDKLDRAHELYLPIYRRRLLEHTRAYPGARETLSALAAQRMLAVLTNKPIRESRLLLEGLGLDCFFRSVYGGDSFPARKPDPVGAIELMREIGAEAEETLFVGDSAVDFETARRASVRFCLVTYGIGATETMKSEPDFRVDDLRELLSIVNP
jgi:phosphoglycolate phosphatase